MAVNRFTVSPRFGELPDPALLNGDLRRILAGSLSTWMSGCAPRSRAIGAFSAGRLAEPAHQPPRLLWFDDEATDATVLEVRARDAIGLLHWVTAALERCAVDIRSARISSLGTFVVDAFYLTDGDGKPLSEQSRGTVEQALIAGARQLGADHGTSATSSTS